MEYVPPFGFKVVPGSPPSLDRTKGKPVHDLLALVYKQKDGRVSLKSFKLQKSNLNLYRLRCTMSSKLDATVAW